MRAPTPASTSTASCRLASLSRTFPWATLMTNGKYTFYLINLTTGDATSLGTFDQNVVDIAIPLKQ